MSLSIAIIAQNEADRIADCIKSAWFADEIVLLDSGSRDATVEIAESLGCRVLRQPWLGYAQQKQRAVDQCRHDWVMILDADEYIPVQTAEIIRNRLFASGEKPAAYALLRKNFFHDRWIRRCGWWPNKVVRIVDRRRGCFSEHFVHEKWLTAGPVQVLDACIEHRSFRDYSDLIHKLQEYSTLSALDMHRRQRTASWWEPAAHGIWMFIKTYLLELGIIEGFDGFMIALTNAGGSFMKYAKLREMHVQAKKSLLRDSVASIKDNPEGAMQRTAYSSRPS